MTFVALLEGNFFVLMRALVTALASGVVAQVRSSLTHFTGRHIFPCLGVTLRTIHVGVFACEWPTCVRVIEHNTR